MHINGACHCGSISFTASIDPSRVTVCHCTDCQVLSGAPLRAVVTAPIESFLLQGTAKRYIKVARSGKRQAARPGLLPGVRNAAIRQRGRGCQQRRDTPGLPGLRGATRPADALRPGLAALGHALGRRTIVDSRPSLGNIDAS